jgi:3-hydroxybutyryl-CoA dehydrogenase
MGTDLVSVGVVGDGPAAIDVAHAFATVGIPVTVVRRIRKLFGAPANIAIDELLAEPLQSTSEADFVEARNVEIDVVTDLADLPTDTALVVVVADDSMETTAATIQIAEKSVATGVLIAVSTTLFGVSDLAATLEYPRRLLGMRFFHPIASSGLVEIIRARDTDGTAVDEARRWTRRIGKTDVVVKDSPGFLTGRLGVALSLEAIRLLEEGVADAWSIDQAMMDGFRYPMGPLTSTDLVGLDHRLAMATLLHETYGERFRPPALLQDMVARGELGRKTGQGFFPWKW